MLTKYKNEIFKHLSHGNLTPRDFRFEDDYGSDSKFSNSKITFLEDSEDTHFAFIIVRELAYFDKFGCFYTIYSPKNVPRFRDGLKLNGDGIDAICDNLDEWINHQIIPYLQDKAEPDLWEEYLKINQNTTSDKIDLTDKNNFSYDEKQQLLIALQNLNISINQNFNLNTTQIKLVNDGIKYLSDGVDRLNKVDWRTILIGQFFTLATTIATNPQAFTALYDMFMKVIQVVHFLPAP